MNKDNKRDDVGNTDKNYIYLVLSTVLVTMNTKEYLESKTD